jgi:hypothetical protein
MSRDHDDTDPNPTAEDTDLTDELGDAIDAADEDPTPADLLDESVLRPDIDPTIPLASVEADPVPVDHPEAFDHFWAELKGRLLEGRTKDVFAVVQTLVDEGVTVVGQQELAARVAERVADPQFEPNRLTAIDALDHLAAAGAVSKDRAVGEDDRVRVRYLIDAEMVDFLTGFPGDPSPRVRAIATYLGAAHLAGRRPDPVAAWVYATVDQYATLADPVIKVRHLGPPDRGDWTDTFPYDRYLLYDAMGGMYAEYAFDVVITSGSDQFEVHDPEELRQALREDLVRYHATGLYHRYDKFSMDAAGAELDAADDTPDPTEPVHSNRLPAYYRQVVEAPADHALWLVGLFQKVREDE